MGRRPREHIAGRTAKGRLPDQESPGPPLFLFTPPGGSGRKAQAGRATMPLDAVVESLDDVPEGVREHYTETDGGYRLAVEGVEFEDEVQGLKSALQKEREARKRYESRLSEIPDDWQDRLEEWESLKEREKKREREKAEKKGEWDKLRSQLQEQHQEQLSEREKRIQTLEQQLDRRMVDGEILSAASEHDAHSHLLLDHAKKFVKVNESNGERRPVVVDENGDRRINSDGEDMSITELVAWMRDQEKYQPLFKPSGATGGGASGNGAGPGGAGKVQSKAELTTRAEKLAFIKEHGDEKYLALPDE